MATLPSCTSTRCTSRSVACGSGLSSSVCGSTTRSRLASAKGSAALSVTRAMRRGSPPSGGGGAAAGAGPVGGVVSASQRCGMRLAASASMSGRPICSAW